MQAKIRIKLRLRNSLGGITPRLGNLRPSQAKFFKYSFWKNLSVCSIWNCLKVNRGDNHLRISYCNCRNCNLLFVPQDLKKSTLPELTYRSKNIFRFFFSHERTSPLPHQQHAQIGPPPPPPVHHYPPSSLAGPGSTSGAPCSRQRFLPFTPTAKGGSLESETSSSTTQESPLDLSVRSSVSSTTSSALMGGAGAAIMSSLKSTLAVSMDNIQQNRPHLFGRPSGTTTQQL